MTEFADIDQKVVTGTELVQGASSDAQTVPQKYALAASGISVRNYIVGEPDGATDYAPAFNQAFTDAMAAGTFVYIPTGQYGIASTVDIKTSVRGASGQRDPSGIAGDAICRLVPLITDGTACMSAINKHGLYIEGFSISAGVTPVNAIGLNLGYSEPSSEATAVRRCVIKDIYISGCAVGLQGSGWINNFENILIHNCTLGARAQTMHDSFYTLRFEGCERGFTFYNCESSHFAALSDEGGPQLLYPSTFDLCNGTTIAYYRCEQPDRGAEPWLEVGLSVGCFNFRILAGRVTECGGGRGAIVLGIVENYEIGCIITAGTDSKRRLIERGANAIGQLGQPEPANAFYNDALNVSSQRLRTNLFPNPYMQGRRFNGELELNNATFTDNTSFEYRVGGTSSMRINPASGQARNYAKLSITDQHAMNAYKSKTLTCGAWVWVGDAANFNNYTYVPKLQVGYEIATAETLFSSTNNRYAPNSWNFFYCTGYFPSSIDKVVVYWHINDGDVVAASSSDFIAVGQTLVVEGKSFRELVKGEWIDSPSNSVQVVGDQSTIYLDSADVPAVKTATNALWKTGDKFIYKDPATFIGEVCITSGTGAGAVWKTYGPITA